jgi:hypothetical protein
LVIMSVVSTTSLVIIDNRFYFSKARAGGAIYSLNSGETFSIINSVFVGNNAAYCIILFYLFYFSF